MGVDHLTTRIILYVATFADLPQSNLEFGELAFTADTNRFYISTSSTYWKEHPGVSVPSAPPLAPRVLTVDAEISSGYSSIVVGDFEIGAGYSLELASNSVFEIS